MKIGIILHPYGEEHAAGLGRAIFEIARSLIAADQKNEYLIFLKERPGVVPEFPGTNWRVVALGGGLWWRERLRAAPQADIYLFNTPVLPLFFRPKKSIVIALDFAYLEFGGGGLWERVRRRATFWYHCWSLRRADLIVAISEATKRHVVERCGLPEERLRVVYLGTNHICALPEEPVAVPEKFFLFVGVFKERKNVFGVVRAFAEFASAHTEYALVLAGRAEGSYAHRIRAYVRGAGLERRVVFLSPASDQQLSFLYRRASALVFPSFVEGFGFPVLEAMSCGLPVITSNVSSLPELAGDAAILADPDSSAEIANAMERITSDPALRERLIAKGRERAAVFSWEKTAREFLRVIEGLAETSNA